MKRLIYFEYIHPIKDYFLTVKRDEFIFEWILPLLISVLVYEYILPATDIKDIATMCGYVINLLAILVGFSVTCLTILSSSGNDNIVMLKDTPTERKLYGKKISLYQLLITNFVFLLVVEFINLFYNLGLILSFGLIKTYCYFPIMFCISIFLTCHIIFLNLRNITNFYFIISRDEDN